MSAELEPPIVFAATAIRKSYGPVHALKSMDLRLRPGKITALMGENGAGKSTLLKIINGDLTPDAGTLTLHGNEVTFHSPSEARNLGVRVVAQEPEIIPHVSVAENIFVGSLSTGTARFSERQLLQRAREIIAENGFTAFLAPETIGRKLSPAQRQLVEICRTLSDDPSVICFDEPTSSLSDAEVDALFALIRKLQAQGKAIVYVSHRMKEVFKLSDTVAVLRDGVLIGEEPTDTVTEPELVTMMVGRDLGAVVQRQPGEPGNVVLELDRVSSEDVSDISLNVRAGEVIAIAGLIGSGRSELLQAIVGHVPLTGGEIKVNGERKRFHAPSDSIKAGIGFAPEERKAEALVMQRSVMDNIALAVLPKIARYGFVKASAEREIAAKYIDRLRIRTPSAAQLVKNLSGGNQQKVVLSRWLARESNILLLDEPTRGIDVGAKAEIYTLIDELAAAGLAVVIVSSELPEVLGLADRIYVMAGGRIRGELAAKDATEESILTLAMVEQDLGTSS